MFNSIELKNHFNDIKHLRESIQNLMTSLGKKVETLNIIHCELLNNNINETTTGLDSLLFQSKLINIELQNHYNMFKIIDNRIYCDYYKMFKILLKFLLQNIENPNTTSTFENKIYPIYKDLEIEQEFTFENTIELYNDIIQMLEILNNEYNQREHKLKQQKIKRDSGLNIDNLINNVAYTNNFLQNNIFFFRDNLNVYNKFHTKYLSRFSICTKLFYGQVNSDIKLEEGKTGIDCKIDKKETVFLDKSEENAIRKCISIDDMSSNKDHTTKKELNNELNIMISGVGKLRELKNNKAFQSSKNVFQNINIPKEIADMSNNILDETKINKNIDTKTSKIEDNRENSHKDNDNSIDNTNNNTNNIDIDTDSDSDNDSDNDSELEYNLKGFCILS